MASRHKSIFIYSSSVWAAAPSAGPRCCSLAGHTAEDELSWFCHSQLLCPRSGAANTQSQCGKTGEWRSTSRLMNECAGRSMSHEWGLQDVFQGKPAFSVHHSVHAAWEGRNKVIDRTRFLLKCRLVYLGVIERSGMFHYEPGEVALALTFEWLLTGLGDHRVQLGVCTSGFADVIACQTAHGTSVHVNVRAQVCPHTFITGTERKQIILRTFWTCPPLLRTKSKSPLFMSNLLNFMVKT